MPNCLELDIGNVTYSGYDENGYLTIQWDSYGTEDGATEGTSDYEGHHPLGFVSRPLDPILDANGNADPTQSCNVLVGLEGGVGHAIPLEDTRVMPLLPQMQKGESMQYGPAWGQFCRMHADGQISLYTTTTSAFNTSSPGQPIFFRINPNEGVDQGFQLVGPWGMLLWGPTGFHVKMAGGGPRMHLGFLGGLPPPLDSLGTYFAVQAGMVSHDAAIVASGPSTAPSGGPPALANPTLLTLTEMSAAITAALNAIPSGGSAASSAFASAMAPILAQAALTVPSQSAAT